MVLLYLVKISFSFWNKKNWQRVLPPSIETSMDYTSSIWFGKLFLQTSFVVVTGWTMTAMSALKFSWFSWNCSGLETSWEVTLSSWNWSFFGGWVEIWSTFFCLIVNIKRRGNLVIEATTKIATILQKKFWSSCWSERYNIQK